MVRYMDAEALYDRLHALFTQLERDEPAALKPLAASRLVLRFVCTVPAAEVTINARQQPIQTQFGFAASRADLEIHLSGDTLHQLLIGELSLKKAVADKMIQLRGPVFKVYALAGLFEQARHHYVHVLGED